MNFRKDINGLRAIAVLAVMVYHFKPEWISGGFAGVDVFFVISGYLMTRIIFSSIESGGFNLLGFYVSRVNRIIPALTFLCAVLLLVGWFVLVPVDYRTLGKHIASSLLFVSNIIYWLESGYFDANSHEKFLLHTWSLSVEWQFYLIYPVFLILTNRLFSTSLTKKLIVFATVIFFIFNCYATKYMPDGAYFLLPARIWEMTLGGIAFLYPVKQYYKIRFSIEKLGLLLILFSFFAMNSQDAWPGYYALVPVFGAYLVILGAQNDSIVTANPLSQFMGKISYSVYLWHWPIVAFCYYYDITNGWWVGMPISIGLGYLSYRYIESIQWNKIKEWREVVGLKPLIIAFVMILAASFTYAKHGVISRYPAERVKLMDSLTLDVVMPLRENGYCFYSFNDSSSIKVDRGAGTQCYLGNGPKKQVDTLIFGDSFAGQYDPFWKKFAEDNKLSIQSVSTNWCFPAFTDNYTGTKAHVAFKQCRENRAFLKHALEKSEFKYLILSADWNAVYNQGYIEDVNSVIADATNRNVKVILVSAPTLYRKNPFNNFQRYMLDGGVLNIDALKVAESGNDYLAKRYENDREVFYISKSALFNSDGLFSLNGYPVPYSLDGMHISLIGALEAYKHFKDDNDYPLLMNYMHLSKD